MLRRPSSSTFVTETSPIFLFEVSYISCLFQVQNKVPDLVVLRLDFLFRGIERNQLWFVSLRRVDFNSPNLFPSSVRIDRANGGNYHLDKC